MARVGPRLLLLALVAAIGVLLGAGPQSDTQQQTNAQQSATQQSDKQEPTGQQTQPGFTVSAERNVVLVRVVVRDAQGRPQAGLQKDDFRLLDNGKLQAITGFSVEAANTPSLPPTSQASRAEPSPNQPALPAAGEQRFVALYFDDVHLSFEDLTYTRQAAEHYVKGSLQPTDLAGVFTSSGQGDLDFTADRNKLDRALLALRPRPKGIPPSRDCPPMTPYEAYLIAQQHDELTFTIAKLEVIQCRCSGNLTECPDSIVVSTVWSTAYRVSADDETQSLYTLRELKRLVGRLAPLPGQKTIVMISPGFFSERLKYELSAITDSALRSQVVISALDARGLYTAIPSGDASDAMPIGSPLPPTPDTRAALAAAPPLPVPLSALVAKRATTGELEKELDADLMAQLADDTGGVFFHNSNDYDGGFRRLAAPAVYYVLAFSPHKLKLDGAFHKLKVELVSQRGLSIQARRGYFAPRGSTDPVTQAREELHDAVYSTDELVGLPVNLETQSFKVEGNKTKLSVVAHVDLRSLRYRKQDGMNYNQLTFVSALFDRSGKYLQGVQKDFDLHVHDASLAKLAQEGLTAKLILEIPPGTYLLREVVREAEEGQVTALSRTVDVP